jgi:hypothetical protein
LLCTLILITLAHAEDRTLFQAHHGYVPEIDIATDVAVVYGVDKTFLDRVAKWREEGYATSMMTGISWGNYGEYYVEDGQLKTEEIQTSKSGRVFMHGNSKTVGYNVPSPPYLEFIKNRIRPAIHPDIQAIYLEEPEYWAETGWSEGFKKEWERYYGEPWVAPDSSVTAQYKASRLKYELYFNALKEVIGFIKEEAAAIGHEIESHVPTHSLLNYAHWRIVSPESHLTDIPGMDGYIAQVWTGTSRTPNVYRGERKERTFETAYLEYGQMWAMVRPTGRKVWFLHDPIEDNPNHTWADYKTNYECTVVASLLWPEVARYEVMPWPDRIFMGQYPKEGARNGEREGMPAEYATQVLAVINALNHMDHDAKLDGFGQRGIGVVVSDSLMFQRAAPSASDPSMGHVYGLALPLLKNGIPVEIVQLENAPGEGALDPYDVLLLTYEGQKPLRPDYHDALRDWVRKGGVLIVVDDGADPYHHVPEWWNEEGDKDTTATQALLAHLGVDPASESDITEVGEGAVIFRAESPSRLAGRKSGANRVLKWVRQGLAHHGKDLDLKNSIRLQRGPYVVANVFDESAGEEALTLSGNFVDLFDPALPVVNERTLQPGYRTVLVDLDWHQAPAVVAAACRVRDEQVDAAGTFRFTTRGPAATRARVRCLLETVPSKITADPAVDFAQDWDEKSQTLLLEFDNMAGDISFALSQ